MATEALKSTSITQIDATPPVRASAGIGGFGTVQIATDYTSPAAAATSPSTHRVLRVPSNCYLKHLWYELHGTITTFTVDCTIYYSDATIDETGSSSGNSGVVNSLSGASALFCHALAAPTSDVLTEITNKNGAYDVTLRQKPLWQAAGLSTDPGGFFDIVLVTTATNSLTAGATASLEVQYVVGWR